MELKGRRIVFLGDSITEGAGVEDIAAHRFDNRIAAKYGALAVNCGIGGTRIAHQHKASAVPRYDLSMCGRAYDLDPDADCIVVFGGTNDYGHGDANFGTFSDTTPDTYCGAVRFLADFLRERYPEACIVFMTPARRLGDSAPDPDPRGANADKRALVEYADAIIRICGEKGIPVLDLFRDLGIDPNDQEQRERYTVDGLHLNDEGHAVLAGLLGAFLEAL